MNKLNRIKNLINTLNEHRDNYYNNQNPTISDYEYDNLFDELAALEKETGIYYSNSPTQSVGYEVKSELKKVKHSHLMQSLDKTKSTEDLRRFAGSNDCILSLKMDGLTVLLTYDNGELIQAETRGNGEFGEEITHNARVFENIPLKIDYKGRFEVEGEAIITYEDFEQINSLIKNPDDRYKNPRNLASGSVRQLDSKIASERHLKFIAWKVPKENGLMTDSFDDIAELGFEVVPHIVIKRWETHFDEYINSLRDTAEHKGFPIDGLVMSYNDIEYGKSLGATGHHPRHSIAYKFYDEEVESNLIDVEWTMGKTGTLCPTAVFEPVEIDGTTVERASLHNISIMKELTNKAAWYQGMGVFVYKANQIIPQISSVVYDDTDAYNAKLCYIPDKCPICGATTKIIKYNDTEVLYCTNLNCKGKLLGKLNAFVSKQGMDISGLSEATLESLINRGYVSSFKDIYHLSEHKANLSALPKMGSKSVSKLLKNIEDSRKTTLNKFLASLSIPLIGTSTSKDIANYCHNSVDEFTFIMENTSLEFAAVDGIGVAATTSLDDWWNENRDMFYELLEELEVEVPEENKTENTNGTDLNSATFCITGKLNHYANRDALIAEIERFNGKYVSSVSSKTDYLINNDKTSTSGKNKKALDVGCKIISEADFMQMCHIVDVIID